MPVLKQFDIYEVSGGQKVLLITLKPESQNELTIEEISTLSKELMEMFYTSDKVKIFTEDGNGFIARGVENKTFILNTILEA
jgi:hypothetical protein